jgi:hypothetical protein
MEPGWNTPRLKFDTIRHHWFRSWLKMREIELVYIDTKEQKVNYLTKSLSTADFELNQKPLVVGSHAFNRETQGSNPSFLNR